ncbi:DUF222 domain-containing protein [Arthrobacter sp. GCM10027362]|uniref:HNH endonuclease signature motif containing protein n=1 Tax=Arthrobacter sp. GCM10027362 TaxID=3273379 RepID=UPI003627059F
MFTGTLAAVEAGTLTRDQAEVVLDQAGTVPEEARRAFEAELLELAARVTSLTRPKFRQRARTLRERRHPESIAARRSRAEVDRRVELRPLEDGMAWLGLRLPAEQAVAAFNRIQELAMPLQGPREARTLTQLRADVAADLLLAGVAGCGTGAGVRAEVMLTIPALTLLGLDEEPAELEGYGPVPADAARRLAGHAPSFVRLPTDPVNGAVLAMDRKKYRPTKAMRQFLRARDKTCTFAICNRSAGHCETDHTTPWAGGGPTDVANLSCGCKKHHRFKTIGAWKLKQPAAGTAAWTSPAGLTYTTEPEPLACTPPEHLATVLERLEIHDVNTRLSALYRKQRALRRDGPARRAPFPPPAPPGPEDGPAGAAPCPF